MEVLVRIVLGVLLVAHGLVHLLWFAPNDDPAWHFRLDRSRLLSEATQKPVAVASTESTSIGTSPSTEPSSAQESERAVPPTDSFISTAVGVQGDSLIAWHSTGDNATIEWTDIATGATTHEVDGTEVLDALSGSGEIVVRPPAVSG